MCKWPTVIFRFCSERERVREREKEKGEISYSWWIKIIDADRSQTRQSFASSHYVTQSRRNVFFSIFSLLLYGMWHGWNGIDSKISIIERKIHRKSDLGRGEDEWVEWMEAGEGTVWDGFKKNTHTQTYTQQMRIIYTERMLNKHIRTYIYTINH